MHEIGGTTGSMTVVVENSYSWDNYKWYDRMCMQARQFVIHKLACRFDILIVVL